MIAISSLAFETNLNVLEEQCTFIFLQILSLLIETSGICKILVLKY